MVSEVDFAVGAMLDLLKEKGIEDNTLVLVNSDNGPCFEFAFTFCLENCRNQVPNPGKPKNLAVVAFSPGILSLCPDLCREARARSSRAVCEFKVFADGQARSQLAH
ncbi:unnamed protein product [Polarella glacialis]|uniref:Sulfatase N-terminal domain-containing protein n=1 Tax=Polarella glacialis TaxID=89957 RepID=A0A813J988_POLGL|nr:unnamed protein product [Polarella glacialis]CAE8672320.1 unnamed protein product [Polarella glacialis]